VRYGGNTPCAVLEATGHSALVLDAGTGLREYARAVRDLPASDLDLVLTHTHWDHIQGLPFFGPLYEPAGRLRLYGPRQEAGLRRVLERLTARENFPIPAAAWAGLSALIELDEGEFEAGGWQVRATRLCHPGHTLGFRLSRPGVAPLAYLTDNELAGGAHGISSGWRDNLVDFLGGVRTLVHDTTWSEEQLGAHKGWGHSSPREAVLLAAEAGCRRLVLFHHHPEHDDALMDRLLDRARDEAHRLAGNLAVDAAIEGLALTLDQEA
jgi:ribonuclease BN (tRNA processing enzyme)